LGYKFETDDFISRNCKDRISPLLISMKLKMKIKVRAIIPYVLRLKFTGAMGVVAGCVCTWYEG
jgi:hypothetical protein